MAAVKWFFHSTLRRSAYRADSFVRIPNLSPFVNALFHFSSFFLICTITSAYPSPTSVQFEKDEKIWLAALRQKEVMSYYIKIEISNKCGHPFPRYLQTAAGTVSNFAEIYKLALLYFAVV